MPLALKHRLTDRLSTDEELDLICNHGWADDLGENGRRVRSYVYLLRGRDGNALVAASVAFSTPDSSGLLTRIRDGCS